eukprot:scaffold265671_cov31-Tisochrysis_lutea.AAC.4
MPLRYAQRHCVGFESFGHVRVIEKGVLTPPHLLSGPSGRVVEGILRKRGGGCDVSLPRRDESKARCLRRSKQLTGLWRYSERSLLEEHSSPHLRTTEW